MQMKKLSSPTLRLGTLISKTSAFISFCCLLSGIITTSANPYHVRADFSAPAAALLESERPETATKLNESYRLPKIRQVSSGLAQLVGTVNVKDVTDDAILAMIILGKNPRIWWISGCAYGRTLNFKEIQ